MATNKDTNNQSASTPAEGAGAPTKEELDMAKAAAAWGGFKIETGILPPKATGTSKYDWASFPAPSNPDDPQTWPSVFIPNIGGKTIYNSIKQYREKVQKTGGKAPEFTVSVSKDPKGVRIIRKS
ncbi:hypothetical protein LZK73_21980 [Neorhizobium galegae]|nr:hypothetical protein LZK73_21980 [Neorhizobium galegae]